MAHCGSACHPAHAGPVPLLRPLQDLLKALRELLESLKNTFEELKDQLQALKQLLKAHSDVLACEDLLATLQDILKTSQNPLKTLNHLLELQTHANMYEWAPYEPRFRPVEAHCIQDAHTHTLNEWPKKLRDQRQNTFPRLAL